MAWYYAKQQNRFGPYTDEQFQAAVAAGTVDAQTMVWRDGMADWQAYGSMADEAGVVGGRCSQCGRPQSPEDMIAYEGQWICAACKPAFFQRIQEGGDIAAMPLMAYAGFWIRFVAVFIDGIILWVINFLVGFVVGFLVGLVCSMRGIHGAPIIANVMLIVAYVIAATYATFFVGKFGATPGKMALGLKIVVADGSRVSYWRAFGRYFATILSGIILCIGYIMAGFDSEKKALHDHICGTRVIRK